jgi:hypothetical protein
MSDPSFAADPKIQQVAEAYALDAVDYARDQFDLQLDFSDDSVQHVETMLTRLHDEMAGAEPSQDQIFQFAKMLGSYVGEVFRRNHGARWGMVTLGSDSFPGLAADKSGGRFWPWGKVQNRLVNGPEDNVWHYFKYLAEHDGRGSNPRPPAAPPPAKRGWWSKLRGG